MKWCKVIIRSLVTEYIQSLVRFTPVSTFSDPTGGVSCIQGSVLEHWVLLREGHLIVEQTQPISENVTVWLI